MSQVSTPQPKLYTARDIERLDDQGLRYELVAGELVSMSPTNRYHGRETGRLFLAIADFVDKHDLGEYYAAETGFQLATQPDTVLAPDISYVRHDRLVGLPPASFVACLPELVVETRSPRDSAPKVKAKLRKWLDFGVPMVLDLDPVGRQLTVYRPGHEPETLGPSDTLHGYDVLPGFTMPLSRVFR